jgi:ArsR family transcriptional regulator
MKEAGLVADRRAGRWIYYRLRPEALEELAGVLSSYEPHESGAGRPGCCG